MENFRKKAYRIEQESGTPSYFSHLGTQGTPDCREDGMLYFNSTSAKTLYSSVYSADGNLKDVGTLYEDEALTIVTTISGYKKSTFIYYIFDGVAIDRQEEGTTC